ncbi:hypothetical protein [Saccharopolyspora phatthalungensis]|uniref:Uncharacterized protein n=1 Tax=Saccharopolyspora phatthalungensis TaxID=664693 RepID=A0A840Q5W1_9PSEU|nr:hypothetical protein [Saccharopolyspora phatthalungensis]MBB5155337.1 hypothetical protein [Saccharopolyspora phatthalungensis]
MADQEFPSGDDDRAHGKRRTGSYFMLPSEQAEQFKRTEAELKKSPDRAIDRDARRTNGNKD